MPDGIVTPHSKQIDGITYTATTYPATEGLRLQARLCELIDPEKGKALIALLVHGDDGGLSDGEARTLLFSVPVLGALFLAAMQRAAACEGWTLPQQLLAHCRADKVRIGTAEVPGSVAEHFDTHFAGRYKHLLDVTVWAARVGFGVP